MMASIEKTAYPRFTNKRLSQKELMQVYSPSADEIYLAAMQTRDLKNKLNFLILLKTFQRLGYFPNFDEIPKGIIEHIIITISTEKDVKIGYTSEKTWHLHKLAIRKILAITPYNSDAKKLVEHIAIQVSFKMNYLPDIINVVIEELIFHGFELSSFSTLDREVKRCKVISNTQIYNKINSLIPDNIRSSFDDMLSPIGTTQRTGYNAIKLLPKRATVSNFKEFLAHHD
jgi:hypothetical protein